MAVAYAIELQGLAEFERALKEVEPLLYAELRSELERAGEPVARTAQGLASGGIRNMTEPWSEFRVGSTGAIVYVAPKQRGRRRGNLKRPNLAGLLLTRAMEPALSANEQLIAGRAQQAVERALRKAGL